MNFFDFKIERGDGLGFGLFSRGHIGYLFLCACLIAGLCLVYRCVGKACRRRLRLMVAWGAVGFELTRAALLLFSGEYSVGRLPLHLCTMAVYILLSHALRGGSLTGQFLFAFCMPGAAAALFLPDWNYYPLFHFMTLCGFVLHALTVGYVLMQVSGRDLRPDIHMAPPCLGLMLLLAAPVYVFDLLADTNYMFLNWPPENTPLMWFAPLGRLYILGYLPLIAIVWTVLYFPFYRKNGKKARTD